MNIRDIITTGLAGYTLVLIIVVIISKMGYATPFADDIMMGGGIALVVAMLMVTTFREET